MQDKLAKAKKIVAVIEEKRIRIAKRVFKEVAKVARKKRLTSKLEPLYIVNCLGGGRELVRG